MADIWDLLASEKITFKRRSYGDHHMVCPQCQGGRTKELSLSVTVDRESGVWICHRAKCGWTGSVRTKDQSEDMRIFRKKTKPEPVKPSFQPKPDRLPASIVDWFAARKISRATLDKLKISYAKVWMPGPNEEVGCIAFPYTRNGEVVNVKYRDSNKHFRQEKGAEKILYGMDWVPEDADTLTWVEGECFPGNVQVLTKCGWVRFDQYSGQDIAQWSNGIVEFVSPINLVRKQYCGELIAFDQKGYHAICTPNHKMVSVDYKGRLRKTDAQHFPPSSSDVIPRCGNMDGNGIGLTKDQLIVCLAIAADGTIDYRSTSYAASPRYCRMGLKKERKISRIIAALDACGLKYHVSIPDQRGHKTICFPIPNWVPGKSLPFGWIVNATKEEREFLLEELINWDGNRVPNRNQTEFSSKHECEAEWVQTLAHTTGRCSSLIHRKNQWGEWWKVSILHGKTKTRAQFLNRTEVQHDGYVYCVSVPSGMLLIRADRKISVSGNCDVLALHEAGIFNVVSVPDGAPMKVKDHTPSPEDDTKFEYVWNCRDFINKFKKHVLAFDDDAPGRALEEEISRRLGREICWRVRWPMAQGDIQIKDANEALIEMGASGLQNCINDAEPYPVKSLFSPDHFGDAVIKLYRDGRSRGLSTGFTNIDTIMTIRPGELSIVTGYPSSGKSEVVDSIAVNMAVMHKWKFAVCSFENPPDEHLAKWAAKYIGMPFYDGPSPRMTEDQLRLAQRWMNDRFFLIRADDESPTMEWVLEKAKVAVMRYGINGLILDPYNEFEHQMRDSQTETKYISDMLGKVKRFAQAHGVHVWFVAHPAKPPKEYQNKAPTLYDISGGANWNNKADIGFSVHRPFNDDGTRSDVAEVHVLKVRFRACGEPGIAKLQYQPGYGGRYTEVTGN